MKKKMKKLENISFQFKWGVLGNRELKSMEELELETAQFIAIK